jgi:hypothetical protein
VARGLGPQYCKKTKQNNNNKKPENKLEPFVTTSLKLGLTVLLGAIAEVTKEDGSYGKRGWVAQCLPSILQALSLSPSTAK